MVTIYAKITQEGGQFYRLEPSMDKSEHFNEIICQSVQKAKQFEMKNTLY